MIPALPTSIVGWWQPENQKWSFELLLLISSSSASMPKHAMREHNMQMQLDTPDSRSPVASQRSRAKIEDDRLAEMGLDAVVLGLGQMQRLAIGKDDAGLVQCGGDEIDLGRAEKARDEAGLRPLIELERRSRLFDLAGIHEHDPVGERHRL